MNDKDEQVLLEFHDWIHENYPTPESAYGRCKEACEKFIEHFQNKDIKIQKGFYYDELWGKRFHYWLIYKDEHIIDPTAIQFPYNGSGVYDNIEDDSLIPTGKCMNCGEFLYNNESFCCKQCERETETFMFDQRSGYVEQPIKYYLTRIDMEGINVNFKGPYVNT